MCVWGGGNRRDVVTVVQLPTAFHRGRQKSVDAGVELRRATVCENLDKSDWVRTVKLLRIGGVYIHDDI